MKLNLWKHIASCAAVAATIAVCSAQPSTVKRTEVHRSDLSIPGREAVMIVAEIPSGIASDRHSHPGDDLGYVLEGTIVLQMDGQPPKTLKAGDVFMIRPGRIHNARNLGSGVARVLDTYIIEKGKPVITPAR
jgi:quercetin dioxygenase-like cupin family protein